MVKVADSIRTERDLILVSPKPADRYSDVALTSLTAYSLFWLHEWNIRRTIEAIAVRAFRHGEGCSENGSDRHSRQDHVSPP